MPGKTVTLTSNTRITFGLLVTLVGAIMWIAQLSFTANATADGFKEYKREAAQEQSLVADKLDSVLGRLSRMEGQLSVIYQNQVKKGVPRAQDDTDDSYDPMLPRLRRRK